MVYDLFIYYIFLGYVWVLEYLLFLIYKIIGYKRLKIEFYRFFFMEIINLF